MAFLFILHYLPCSSSIPQLRVKISKEGVDQGVALYASTYANKLKISNLKREYVSTFCSIVLQKVRKQHMRHDMRPHLHIISM